MPVTEPQMGNGKLLSNGDVSHGVKYQNITPSSYLNSTMMIIKPFLGHGVRLVTKAPTHMPIQVPQQAT